LAVVGEKYHAFLLQATQIYPGQPCAVILDDLFKRKNRKFRIILCHPFSPDLEEHCRNEKDQDLVRMRAKIIDNTNKFLTLGADNCEVKWYFNQPEYHMVGNEREIHLGYYPQGREGHYSRRYIVKKTDALFRSLTIY
jgi:hypothetical protein